LAPERVSVLVHLGPGADRGALRGFAAANGGRVKYEYDVLPNVVNVRGLPETALSGLTQLQGVVRIEPDATVQAHMNGSTPLIGGLQSQLTAAGMTADGSGVRVCIIDTGIDSDNFMYASRIDTVAGRDFVNNDNNPEDDDGHGSHVAGTVAGGTGINVDLGCGQEPLQGIAPAATLIGIKVLDANGSGTFSDVIAGIDHCADQSASGGRADVINMSLGGGSYSGTCDTSTAAAAANAAVDAGVVVVASAGNSGSSNAMGTPACGSKVIAVGATYDDDYPNCELPNQDSFSFCTKVNRIGLCTGICTDTSPGVDDLVCFSNRSTELDVVAPGCVTFSANYENSAGAVVGFCGTSMASPHVAGLAALLLSADPALPAAGVRQLIRDGATDLGSAGFDPAFGHGRIDVSGSLSLLGGPCSVDSDCDDADACTNDACVSGSCSNTALDCSDGDPCTTDTCSAGVCSSSPMNCDDGDACTTDSCSGGPVREPEP
jgi:serine protease AprX